MMHQLAIREAAQHLLNVMDAGGALGAPVTLEQNWGREVAQRLARVIEDPRASAERGYLYIIPTEVEGVWKIGKTDNLKRRLGGYQTGRATPVTYAYHRSTLEQHLAEKILKELLKQQAFTVGSADETKQQRMRELFRIDLQHLKPMLDECCLTASVLLLYKWHTLIPTEGPLSVSPLSSERIAAVMQMVDRFVTALIHAHGASRTSAVPLDMLWYKPGEAVDMTLPLVDFLERTDVPPENMPIVQALLFDRLVASRTTCYIDHANAAETVGVKLRTPEEIRSRIGHVVYEFEIAAVQISSPSASQKQEEKNEKKPARASREMKKGATEAVAAATAKASPKSTTLAPSPVPPSDLKDRPAEERKRASTDEERVRHTPELDQDMQKFTEWILEEKPGWAAKGMAVTTQELHEHYKARQLTTVGQRMLFKWVKETLKCEKIKVSRGNGMVTALKFP